MTVRKSNPASADRLYQIVRECAEAGEPLPAPHSLASRANLSWEWARRKLAEMHDAGKLVLVSPAPRLRIAFSDGRMTA